MTFGESVKTCFRKYFVFRGRASRSEFWWFQLFVLVVGIALSFIDSALFGQTTNRILDDDLFERGDISASFYSIFPGRMFEDIFDLATLMPTLTVSARRLHDIGKTGWWQVIPFAGLLLMAPGFYMVIVGEPSGPATFSLAIGALVALVLFIMLIVWYCRDSERGANRFGESSKYRSVGDTFS